MFHVFPSKEPRSPGLYDLVAALIGLSDTSLPYDPSLSITTPPPTPTSPVLTAGLLEASHDIQPPLYSSF